MKTKTIMTLMITLFLLTIPLASSISTAKAEEYNRIVFQSIAKGSGRIMFYSAPTGYYQKSFDEGTVTIMGTSEIEGMGSWYLLKKGTVKIGGTIWVEWTYNDKKYELRLIPKVGRKTSGYLAWCFRIDHMMYKSICSINDKVEGVSEGIMFITLLTNQISVGFDITVEDEPASITLDWFSDSAAPPGYSAADVFGINTQLI